MLAAQDVAAWLGTRGITDTFSVDGNLSPQPDRLVIVTITGGTGTLRERTFDSATVQVRTRGRQNNNADGQQLAQQVDDAIMGTVPPVTIGGRRVISIDYLGGQPAFLQRDASRRAVFSCNYIVQVARTVF